MKDYTRNCPKCGVELKYTYRGYKQAEKKNSQCIKCSNTGRKHSEETKKKLAAAKKGKPQPKGFAEFISAANRGKNNGMYGRSVYQLWIGKYGSDEANRRMTELREKRFKNATGCKNSMYGKATPQGSGNGWSGWYKGWYFRSLHELSYMINYIEKNGLKWRSGETRDLDIHYKHWNGSERTYRADFLIEEKYLVEVKPSRLKSCRLVELKRQAAEKFCTERGYKYRMETANKITDKQFLELHNDGTIKFIPRYEVLFQERFSQ